MISLEGVTKRYPNGTVAVDDLSLEVDEGEVCVLVGPSGCGKTTTLRMINRLIDLTSGRIVVAGRDIMQTDPVELRRHVGYVIQHVGLFPHQTVGDQRRHRAEAARAGRRSAPRERVDELLDAGRARPGDLPATATRRSSRVASSSVSGWPAPWPPTRPCC